MKAHIKQNLENMNNEQISDNQCRWELLKYEIRKFSIAFSKNLAKNTKAELFTLEKKLKLIESSANHQINPEYLECKNRLENIYEEKANGIRIRSKCSWYEQGEKSSKNFLNLEFSQIIKK